LVKALDSLAISIKKDDVLKKKVKSSLTYPLVIFLFLFLAVIIVLIYVIPSLMPLFENSDAELPDATVALIATSNFLQNYYLVLLFLLFSFIVFIVGYKATES
jgi:type II secretory pathway component PulF